MVVTVVLTGCLLSVIASATTEETGQPSAPYVCQLAEGEPSECVGFACAAQLPPRTGVGQSEAMVTDGEGGEGKVKDTPRSR